MSERAIRSLTAFKTFNKYITFLKESFQNALKKICTVCIIMSSLDKLSFFTAYTDINKNASLIITVVCLGHSFRNRYSVFVCLFGS